jgi:AraC-like DNA-binding protein
VNFYFSVYSTPLLFGFVQGWIYALLLWVRGRREERLSDLLLGWVLVAAAFQIWEYMLGFGGIEILWKELDFFPRNLDLLLPPLWYFYFRSQIDATFRFHWRDAWHALPFALFCAYHLLVFAQGPAFVRTWQERYHYADGIHYLEYFLSVFVHFFYLYRSFQLYRQYRAWMPTQFSETESISFRWFRNFLLVILLAEVFGVLMTVADLVLDLDYTADWWDELFGAVLIYYVSINGYSQVQPGRRLTFRAAETEVSPVAETPPVVEPSRVPLAEEWLPLRTRLLDWMETKRPYLDPDLALPDLARQLAIPAPLLSQVINAGLGKNFSDFINEYRVAAFKRAVRDPANRHLTLLGVALDCGFNSKATFNRAFRKGTGRSPKEFASLPEPGEPIKME